MVVKLDLHVHTKYSNDGFAEIKDLAKQAKQLGLDGFAITDHDTIAGLKEAKKIAKQEKIIIIPGIEISSKDGDIIALGIKKKISRGLSAEETIKRIHKQKAIAIAPHPFGKLYHTHSVELLAKQLPFDAVEAFNSRCYYANKLAQKIKKPKTAGSDAHIIDEFGRAYTIINSKNILNAIKTGKTKIKGKSIRTSVVIKYAVIRLPTLILDKLKEIFGKK